MKKRLVVKNGYIEKTVRTSISPGLTVIVGRNGYGKTSFLHSLAEQLDKKKIPYVSWSDNEYGRGNGREILLYNDNIEGLASMTCHSEGESMLASFGNFFMRKAGRAVSNCVKNNDKEIFFFIDQLDSGLDIYQIDDIKKIIKETILPDLKERKITGYFLVTANSYEMVDGEDCIDPVTGKHHSFNSLSEYREYIKSQY